MRRGWEETEWALNDPYKTPMIHSDVPLFICSPLTSQLHTTHSTHRPPTMEQQWTSPVALPASEGVVCSCSLSVVRLRSRRRVSSSSNVEVFHRFGERTRGRCVFLLPKPTNEWSGFLPLAVPTLWRHVNIIISDLMYCKLCICCEWTLKGSERGAEDEAGGPGGWRRH